MDGINNTSTASYKTKDGDKIIQKLIAESQLSVNDINQNVVITESTSFIGESAGILTEKNIFKMDKATRLKVLAGRAALIAAREKNDPMFKKMMIFRKRYKELKTALLAKYGHVGISRARMSFSTGSLTATR